MIDKKVKSKIKYIWAFCPKCKCIQRLKAQWPYYDHGLPPVHQHKTDVVYMITFDTKKVAEWFKKDCYKVKGCVNV